MNDQPIVRKEKISRKDLIYWFIIFDLLAFVSGIFTWKFKDSQDVINQISLVSSISSILLALVAIIYAFFQTMASTKQNDFLQNTICKIDEKINELGDVKDEFSLIKDEFSSFRESSKSDKTEILAVLSQYQEIIQQNNEAIINNLKEKQITIPQDIKESVLEKTNKNLNIYFDSIKDRVINYNPEKEKLISKEIFRYIQDNYKNGDSVNIRDISRFIRNNFSYTENGARLLARRIFEDFSHPQSILEKVRIKDNLYGYIKKEEFPGGPSHP